MILRTKIAVSILGLALSLQGCKKKKDSSSDTEEESPAPQVTAPTASSAVSATRSTMAGALNLALTDAGLSESQVAILVDAGKSKTAGANLIGTAVLNEIEAFVEGSTEALDELGTLPEGKTINDILEVVVGSNIGSLNEVLPDATAAELLDAVGEVTQTTTGSLGDAGFAADELNDAFESV